MEVFYNGLTFSVCLKHFQNKLFLKTSWIFVSKYNSRESKEVWKKVNIGNWIILLCKRQHLENEKTVTDWKKIFSRDISKKMNNLIKNWSKTLFTKDVQQQAFGKLLI
jgi:hypothetical protein